MENLRQNETLKKVSNKEYLENGYIVLKNFLNPGVTKYFNGRTFRYGSLAVGTNSLTCSDKSTNLPFSGCSIAAPT